MLAIEPRVMPSTSFSGASASQASFSLRCFGSGRNMRTPWTASSSLRERMAASSSSCVTSAGSSTCLTATPFFSALFRAPRSYARSSSLSPTRRMARVGVTPLAFRVSTRLDVSRSSASAVGLPFNTVLISDLHKQAGMPLLPSGHTLPRERRVLRSSFPHSPGLS